MFEMCSENITEKIKIKNILMALFLFRSPAHDVMYFGSDGG